MTAVLSALGVQLHKVNVEYDLDNDHFFTTDEIDALHCHTVTLSIEHPCLTEDLCLLDSLRFLHILGD